MQESLIEVPKSLAEKAVNYRVSIPIKIIHGSNVMPPTSYSELLGNYLPDYVACESIVLDVGCGTGFLSLIAAKCGAKKIVASDINEYAIAIAKRNLSENYLHARVELVQSDLFSSLQGRKFSVIVSNPPFLPIPYNRVNNSAIDGRDVLDRLILESNNFLCPGGILLFTHSSLAGIQKTKRMLSRKGFDVSILAEHKMEFRKCAHENLGFVLKAAELNRGEYLVENDKYYEKLFIVCASLKDSPQG